MKEGIHPKYQECVIACACGYSFESRSTKPGIKVEICSNCHPFFTGKQKLIDTAGRVEKFQRRFAKTEGKTVVKKKTAKKAEPKKKAVKILSTSPKKSKTTAAKKDKKEEKSKK